MSRIQIEISDLSYRYRDAKELALDGVSLRVCSGEFVVITGPSGCGKSTLSRCLNGLIPHASDGTYRGTVFIKGMDVRECDVSDLSPHIGMVFQDPENQLLANTVEMEIAFGPENLGLKPEETLGRVDWALSVVGIEDMRNRLIDELSGGEKQRVAIAASMAMKPDILVLDEPTSEIDPRGAHSLIETLKALNDREGLTIMLIEHRIERLLGAMGRLVVMDKGRIVHDGPPEEVFRNDLDAMGVYMPPLVRFSQRFGLPYVGSVSDIRAEGAWTADIRECAACGSDVIASLRDVRYRYPGVKRDALNGVSLDFHRGEITAIMGGNGSGKTTLVKHLNGLLKPSKGQVLLNGRDIGRTTVAENARTIGFVLQNVNHQLFEETVLDELIFGPMNMGFAADDARRRARSVAESLNLDDQMLSSSPMQLSGGQKQRVAIASALTPGPEVIVLDEPTLGLNHGLKEKLAVTLRRMKGENKAVILVTHDTEFAVTTADRIVLMSRGTVIADGKTRDILTSDQIAGAALHLPQASEIGKRLGVSGILTIEELESGVP
jgi:energy-coupling factor transporter ATP-binding protein EcfA2